MELCKETADRVVNLASGNDMISSDNDMGAIDMSPIGGKQCHDNSEKDIRDNHLAKHLENDQPADEQYDNMHFQAPTSPQPLKRLMCPSRSTKSM